MTRSMAAALCALALYQGAAPSGPAGAPDRGLLAVLRRDGLLLPFAAFKGGDWSLPWPSGTQGRELPVDLDSIPDAWWGGKRPEAWTVYLPDGETRPVHVTAPGVYRAGCATRIGLKTDYRSRETAPPEGTDPYPKDGLAVTSGIAVTPIPRVSLAAPAAADLTKLLAGAFDEAEEKTVRAIRNREGWRHPLNANERHALPIKLEAWYRASLDQPGYSISYIEASRSYPPRPEDNGCGLDTYVTGWIHHNERTPDKPKFDLDARVTYCDRAGVLYMLPLGMIRVKDRLHWVFQSSGWEQEWYRVARVLPSRVQFVAEFYGGGRRGCPF